MLGGILFANTSSSFFPPKKYGSQSIRVTVELVAWSETLVASSRATKILKKFNLLKLKVARTTQKAAERVAGSLWEGCRIGERSALLASCSSGESFQCFCAYLGSQVRSYSLLILKAKRSFAR